MKGQDGVALFIEKDADINISHTKFLRNSAKSVGSSITLSDSNLTMTYSTLDQFTGGAILA